MVNLVTSDNKVFSVDKATIERSVLIRNLLEDLGETDQPIPLPIISSGVLEKIIEYCTYHRGEPLPDADEEFNEDYTRKRSLKISDWDQTFMAVDPEMVCEIVLAANYLDIKQLLDIGCKTVTNMIKGKDPDEIRKIFKIENDFAPAEEEQIKKENRWAGGP